MKHNSQFHEGFGDRKLDVMHRYTFLPRRFHSIWHHFPTNRVPRPWLNPIQNTQPTEKGITMFVLLLLR